MKCGVISLSYFLGFLLNICVWLMVAGRSKDALPISIFLKIDAFIHYFSQHHENIQPTRPLVATGAQLGSFLLQPVHN
jgi:hypothetical protein